MTQKIIKLALGLIFLVFVFVQFNDPDLILWIFAYGSVSGVLIYGAFRPVPKKVILIALVVIGGYSLTLVPEFFEWLSLIEKQEIFGDMVYEKPYLEETREFLGLWMAWFSIFYLYKNS